MNTGEDLIKRMLEAFYPSTSLSDADITRVTPFMRDAALVLLAEMRAFQKPVGTIQFTEDKVLGTTMKAGPLKHAPAFSASQLDVFARVHGLEAKT